MVTEMISESKPFSMKLHIMQKISTKASMTVLLDYIRLALIAHLS